MTTVTGEDRKLSMDVFSIALGGSREQVIAESRERIEARVRAECTADLIGRDKRIAELERNMRDFTFAVGTAAGLRDVGCKAPEQIVDAVQYQGGRIAQLAAAKPVLTMCNLHRTHVDECRAYVAKYAAGTVVHSTRLLADLVHVVDTLCPPPKAPPTDAELIEMLINGLPENEARGHHLKSVEAMFAAIDVLRARGAK